jgi:hypothetical protein
MRDKTKSALDASDSMGIDDPFFNHGRLLSFANFTAKISCGDPNA